MTLKITTRLTLWYLGVFGSAVLLIATARYLLFSWGEQQKLDRQGMEYAQYLLASPNLWNKPLPNLASTLDSLNATSDLRFRSLWFFLHDGHTVLYDNSIRNSVPPLLDSLLVRMHTNPQELETIEFNSNTYRTWTVAGTDHYKEDFYLTVVMPREEIDGSLSRLLLLMIAGVVVFLVVAWKGGSILAKRTLSPVEQLRSTAADITATNLSRRVVIKDSKDELSELAKTFNNMIARLERSVQTQRQFITSTSHDLRTPLATIRAELQIAIKSPATSTELRDTLNRCLRQLDRVDRLTGDLLLLAKADADGLQLNQESVRIDELLLEAVADVQTLTQEKDIALDINLPEAEAQDIMLRCDPHLVRRAILNLLDNALRYSPSNSTIQASLVSTPEAIEISIHDDGPGIAQEEQRQIFDRLYRGSTSQETTGSGLGLAIVKEIVLAHSGSITVESEPFNGTTFTLFFPRL